MDTKKIKQIISLFEESSLSAMDLEVDDIKIKMEKPQAHITNVVSEVVTPVAQVREEIVQETHPVISIKSPIVGTFYAASKTGAKPFVSLGDTVKKGDVVCIVEAMKAMNEIKSNVDGVVKEVLVQDGQLVEYDQPMFVIGD